MRADDVLLMQADLGQRMRDHRFRTYFTAALSDQYAPRTHVPKEGIERVLAEGVEQHIRLADVYRVTEDMCELLVHAADSLDETDTIDHTLAPSEWGLVRFEKPLPMREIRGRTMLIHWATWGPAVLYKTGQRATFVTMWNDPLTQADEVWLDTTSRVEGDPAFEGLRQSIGRWAIIGGEVMMDGKTLGPRIAAISEEERAFREAQEYDQSMGPLVPITEAGEFTNVQRYIHALWLLCGQTVTTVEPERVRTATVKRLVRAKFPGRVSVITLRHHSPKSTGTQQVEWHHKWIVKGHWAWRVCGPDHPLAQEAPVKGGIGCRVYIAPYVKGPEDAPLMQSSKVYQLSR